MTSFSNRIKEIGLTEEDKLLVPGIGFEQAASYTLEGFKSAYTRMNYDQFLELLGGRDDAYWQEQWDNFIKAARYVGKLGSFFPILVNHGHELRSE